MEYSPALFSFFLLLISSVAATTNLCSSPSVPTDISIFHVQSKCTPFSSPSSPPSPSELDSVLATSRSDPARLLFLSQKIPTKVPIASGLQFMNTNNYVLRVKLGTPGQLLFPAVDTGSDASWVPCVGCNSCPATNATFVPSASSTYASIDCGSLTCPQFKGLACASVNSGEVCGFNMTYGGDSSFSGMLAEDELRLGMDELKGYPFGCVNAVVGGNSMPRQGLLGLGRGSAGLLAQADSLYKGVFSYCLPSFKSYYYSGSLRLGPIGQPKTIRTTPLLFNPHRPSLYYVNLTSISIGRTIVAIPAGSFDFDPQTGAGTIVDSGTVITRFVAPAYVAIRDEFRRQVNASSYSSLGAFDTCFTTSGEGPLTPAVTFHLAGLDLTLPVENTLIHSSARPLACLAMAAAPDNVNNVVNVIANYQQQNHRVLIDVANSKVGFGKELCS